MQCANPVHAEMKVPGTHSPRKPPSHVINSREEESEKESVRASNPEAGDESAMESVILGRREQEGHMLLVGGYIEVRS